ncbi:helix-turn-helix domain-containing protein [Kitasatospora sp. NPDC002551]|uniref:TetR/AcrR family transcriptional regulator n=1 Tax=unclassified Kitasatospora TaxID=2633591 RepID=UPI00332EC1A1
MAMKRGSYRTGRERVERILDASHELFVQAGYRATSLRDIAAASGISHPALLRHFGSKEEILTALVERIDRRHGNWLENGVDDGGPRVSVVAAARRNEAEAGWIPLFTALLGEATSPEHPGHELMRTRRRLGSRLGVRLLGGQGGDERSVKLAVQRLGAVWDGLQILSLYFPGRIDIPGRLADFEDDLRANGIPPAPPAPVRGPDASPGGEATGEAAAGPEPTPRARAFESAARLYAAHGYYGTSMQAVADGAGLTKAALVHIAPTKRALLDLVVAELTAPAPDEADPGSRLKALLDRPRWQSAAEMVLMCEATVPSHPAHALMAGRLEYSLSSTVRDLASAGSPAEEGERQAAAQWLVALALGALIAWLYEPGDVELGTLIEEAVPPRPRARVACEAPAG